MAKSDVAESNVTDDRAQAKKLAEDRARRAEEQKRKESIKNVLEWIFFLSVVFGFLGYYAWNAVQRSLRNLQFYTTLNQTTSHISQLVDNIRNYYKINNTEEFSSMEELIKNGAIPEVLVSDGVIMNPFGGNVVIQVSEPLENVVEGVESPTFKMSYQGLSHKACVALATLDWGNDIKGLLAVALGSVDFDTNEDSALKDVDAKQEEVKPVQYKDKRGRIRYYKPYKEMKMNVAKPNDDFIPTPFAKEAAMSECACVGDFNCSVALRYTIYGVDKPIRGDKQEEN